MPTGQPSVFFTDNVGKSTSKGAELEANLPGPSDEQKLDVFGGIGYTNAQFKHYTQTSGVSATAIGSPSPRRSPGTPARNTH